MKNKDGYSMPIYMCLGTSIGLAIGTATGNMPLYMVLGMSIGICIGAALDASKRK